MDVFISAARVASSDDSEEIPNTTIQPGQKAICNAFAKLIIDKDRYSIKVTKAKLDSCGSVSIAHTNLLNDIQPAHKYKLPKIRLRGIGVKSDDNNYLLLLSRQTKRIFSSLAKHMA